MELKNKWRLIWLRIKARRKEKELDTAALMKRELYASSIVQGSLGNFPQDDNKKTISFCSEQVSEKQIDRSAFKWH